MTLTTGVCIKMSTEERQLPASDCQIPYGTPNECESTFAQIKVRILVSNVEFK